jgi:hypothetical protein
MIWTETTGYVKSVGLVMTTSKRNTIATTVVVVLMRRMKNEIMFSITVYL